MSPNGSSLDLDSSELPAPGVGGRFLLACCGANSEHLHEGAERNWYYSLGFSVIVTALTAGLSASLLILATFSTAPMAVIVGAGIFWAIVVFNLDRLIVSRVLGRPNVWNKLGLFGARFILAAGVAILMAEGVELILFESEIDQQVRLDNAEAQQNSLLEWQQKVATATEDAKNTYAAEIARPGETETLLITAISTLNTSLADANKVLACETRPNDFGPGECESGTGIIGFGDEAEIASNQVTEVGGQLAAARGRLTAYTITPVDVTSTFTREDLEVCGFSPTVTALTPKDSDTCSAALLVNNQVKQLAPAVEAADTVDGPIRRIAALSALASGEHGTTIWIVRLLLFIVVASIDLVPLTAKLFGGATGHDIRARIDNIRASSKYAQALENEVHAEAQELHSTPRGGGSFMGFGWGHRHRVAQERDDFHLERLRNQAAIEKARWKSPDRLDDQAAETADEDGAAVASSSQQVAHEGEIGPGYILTAHLGADQGSVDYVVESKLPARSYFYKLWLCRRVDESDGRTYVAKVCYVDDENDLNSGLTFLNRDVHAANLHNEHVIEIVSGKQVQHDKTSGARFVVMPFYSIGHLLDYAQAEWTGPVPYAELLHLTRQILEGLLATHAQGFLHLDIKPENILIDVSEDGRGLIAVITDFGIAAVIGELEAQGITNTFTGTEPFAPLEQVLPGSRFGRRKATTDLWAVGAIVFKMITGHHPRYYAEEESGLTRVDGRIDRNDESFREWMWITEPSAPRLDKIQGINPPVPREVADLVEQWLENEPEQRITPGTNNAGRASTGVMTDALACLDGVIGTLR